MKTVREGRARPTAMSRTRPWSALIDAEPGQASISLQLAGAKQTLELGPLFVLDLGPNRPKAQ